MGQNRRHQKIQKMLATLQAVLRLGQCTRACIFRLNRPAATARYALTAILFIANYKFSYTGGLKTSNPAVLSMAPGFLSTAASLK
jgi:hypothetical protein